MGSMNPIEINLLKWLTTLRTVFYMKELTVSCSSSFMLCCVRWLDMAVISTISGNADVPPASQRLKNKTGGTHALPPFIYSIQETGYFTSPISKPAPFQAKIPPE